MRILYRLVGSGVSLSKLLHFLKHCGGKEKERGGGGGGSSSRSQKTKLPGRDGLKTDELNNLQVESSS